MTICCWKPRICEIYALLSQFFCRNLRTFSANFWRQKTDSANLSTFRMYGCLFSDWYWEGLAYGMGETGSMILFGLPQKIAKFIVLKSPFQVAHLQNHGGADWPPSNRMLFRLICCRKKVGKVQSSFSSRFAQSPKGKPGAGPLECNFERDFTEKTFQNISTSILYLGNFGSISTQIQKIFVKLAAAPWNTPRKTPGIDKRRDFRNKIWKFLN